MKKLFLCCLLAVSFACSNDDDATKQEPINCTEEFVFGLNVEVRDANTGTIIPSGVTVLAKDEAYTETLAFMTGVHVGAGERPGTYTLTASREDYETKIVGPITVVMDDDMCHVVPQNVTIALEPN